MDELIEYAIDVNRQFYLQEIPVEDSIEAWRITDDGVTIAFDRGIE